MNKQELKKFVQMQTEKEEEEINRIFVKIVKVIGLKQAKKITYYEAVERIEKYLKEIDECDRNIGEYWRVENSLDYLLD